MYTLIVYWLQAGLQWTLQRVFLSGVQRTVQPLLRPVWIFSQWHVHRPDQPHVRLRRQPPWMVTFPYISAVPAVLNCLLFFIELSLLLQLLLKCSSCLLWLLCADPKIEVIYGVLCKNWISDSWLTSFASVTLGWMGCMIRLMGRSENPNIIGWTSWINSSLQGFVYHAKWHLSNWGMWN